MKVNYTVRVIAEYANGGRSFFEASGLREANGMARYLIYEKGAKRVRLMVVNGHDMPMGVKNVYA